MSGKSVFFDGVSQAWILEVSEKRGKGFSAALQQIVKEHKQSYPDQEKQKQLRRLRESAAILFKEFEVPQEALISWVVEVSGGWGDAKQ